MKSSTTPVTSDADKSLNSDSQTSSSSNTKSSTKPTSPSDDSSPKLEFVSTLGSLHQGHILDLLLSSVQLHRLAEMKTAQVRNLNLKKK